MHRYWGELDWRDFLLAVLGISYTEKNILTRLTYTIMKNTILFLFIILTGPSYAQDSRESDSLRNMLIITCHPDDWELSMAGTAYLLKDK